MEKARSNEGKYSFIAVFVIGIVLLLVSARYIYRHEVADERQERDRRIAAEVERFKR